MHVLNAALVEMPFKLSAPIIQHINAEIQKAFDKSNDAVDMPSGSSKPVNEFYD